MKMKCMNEVDCDLFCLKIAEEKELVLKEVKVIMEDSPDKEKAIAGEGNGSRGESGETQQVNGGTENAKETAD